MINEKEIEKMRDVFMRPLHYEALDWFQAMNTFRLAYNYGYKLIKPCLNVISRDDLLERALFVPIAPLKIGEETHCEYVVFVDDIQKMPETMPLTKDYKEAGDGKRDSC